MQKPEPVLAAHLFPEVQRALLGLLEGLTAEDWEKPTVCSGWSVKDVALHLLGGEIGNLSRRRDGHVLPASINGWDALVAFINDWNQDWVRVGRRISARLLVDLLRQTGDQMNAYFLGLDPYTLGGAVSWAGPDPAPVWLDLAREYTERWHHQQHIRAAVGRPGLMSPRYLAPVLQAFMFSFPYTFREVKAPEGMTVTITITGSAGGCWTIRREGVDWQLYSGMPQQPDAEVKMAEDLAWQLFTRGVSQEDASGQLIFKGNRDLGSKVLEMVAIIA